MHFLDTIKFSYKLWALVIVSSLSLIALEYYSFTTIDEIKVNGPVYEKIIIDKDLIADILPPPEYLVESYLVLFQLSVESDPSRITQLLGKFDALEKDYQTRHAYWQEKEFPAETKSLLLEDSYTPAKEFYAVSREKFLPAVQSGNRELAGKILQEDIKTAYEAHRAVIDKIVVLATASGAANETAAKEAIGRSRVFMVLSAVILISFIILFAVLLIGNMMRAMKRLRNIAESISVGDLHEAREVFKMNDRDLRVRLLKQGDEIMALEDAFEHMTIAIGEQVQVAESIAEGRVDTLLTPKSAKDELTISLNKISEALRKLIHETQFLTEEANRGHLSSRGNAQNFENGFQEIILGFNLTLDTVLTPIRKGEAALKKVADGNLTTRINDTYKGDHELLKNSINKVAESLQTALVQVSEVIQHTVFAATQIMDSSKAMSRAAEDQSQQTAEVATAIEQMTKTIFENTRAVSMTGASSKQASEMAIAGTEVITETMNGMGEIVKATSDTGGMISSLAKKTEQIGEIVQVITDIAEQTNLLALNAAIESARAGEQGRGFAVVADEVRKLAERTTKATKEISDTIRVIQNEAHEADKAMSRSVVLVKNGMSSSQKVSEIFAQLRLSNESVKDMLVQISAASEEQSATAEQISKIVDSIHGVTNLNVNEIKQMVQASVSLNKLAGNLDDLIHQFELHEENLLTK
ncbi:MAG: methyl-accepting chemotaxis protein [Ignavibacteriales bacterium]|nr:methyl-accepting chemotaxis protein [Ignavibacteriales bacterium]